MAADMRSLPPVDIVVYPEHFHEWNVSAEGDVFIRKDDVTILSWRGLRKNDRNINDNA
jgi:hypothetical protein